MSETLDASTSSNKIKLQQLIKDAFPAPKADVEDLKNEEDTDNSVMQKKLDDHSSNACLPLKVQLQYVDSIGIMAFGLLSFYTEVLPRFRVFSSPRKKNPPKCDFSSLLLAFSVPNYAKAGRKIPFSIPHYIFFPHYLHN